MKRLAFAPKLGRGKQQLREPIVLGPLVSRTNFYRNVGSTCRVDNIRTVSTRVESKKPISLSAVSDRIAYKVMEKLKAESGYRRIIPTEDHYIASSMVKEFLEYTLANAIDREPGLSTEEHIVEIVAKEILQSDLNQ
jgi:hypothetical protein